MAPKLSALWLRDVVMIWLLEDKLSSDEDFICCLPIDTWVRKCAAQLGMVSGNEHGRITAKNDRIAAENIIKECRDADVSPLLFDAGAWMIGFERKELCKPAL